MASRTNPQNVVINNASSGLTTLFTNPSKTAFAWIWEFALVVGGATNITFFNGAGPLTGAYPMLTSGSIFRPDEGGGEPVYRIDPGASFIVNDSAGVQKSGYVIYSN